ncbi:hypothetical protein L3X38_041550 [Prunus dulcis]|uniref:Uncharacterized protein n=1 Tax=Prunus dulcis TaxID=3755 RepID=A0AAD4UV49_PRUDU|nr:hypothetical protein L3X38_041550 [Prunus dulcis]
MVLSSAAKKWKDFKSTLTRQFILPFANEKEKLKVPSQLYNFIEKSQWDAFVASRLSQDFEAVHSEQSQRREKCEYNHRLSRKGEDKQGNIPDPKDDLNKQVSEGTLTVSGSNDVLTLALGTPEHGGRVRGVGAGVSPTQFFNLPRQQRVKFADKLKESVMEAVREETKKMEAKAKQSVLEAVRAEREILFKQFSQLISNFDPNFLASCSNVLQLEEDNPTNDADADAVENRQYETDLSKIDMPAPLLALCQYVETNLKPANENITIHMPGEVFGIEHDTWLLCEDVL